MKLVVFPAPVVATIQVFRKLASGVRRPTPPSIASPWCAADRSLLVSRSVKKRPWFSVRCARWNIQRRIALNRSRYLNHFIVVILGKKAIKTSGSITKRKKMVRRNVAQNMADLFFNKLILLNFFNFHTLCYKKSIFY